MNHLVSLERVLICCSCFDLIYSTLFIISVGLYVATCRVEDETVIDHKISLDQIKFFYNALEECGFKEEGDIPSSDIICTDLENRVMPYGGLSLALNFVLAVYMQIMIHDSQFFLDKEFNKYSHPVSLISIPIGTLFSMSLAAIALNEYTKPNMCWLAYSITEQKKADAYVVATTLVPIILLVYKPLELSIFYMYGCRLFRNQEKDADQISKINLVSRMSEIETNEIPESRPSIFRNKIGLKEKRRRSTNMSTQT